MSGAFRIRAAERADLPALVAIYNHYITHTAITFDLVPITVADREPWFDEHRATGRHRLIVAVDEGDRPLGYATTSAWRQKAAYDTTVEASIYCDAAATGRGAGRALYAALFEIIAREDIHCVVAGMTLPNDASRRLHDAFGFVEVGVFHRVGRKFDQYWDVGWYERAVTPGVPVRPRG
jgi:phosphinothricin acetyltransferase